MKKLTMIGLMLIMTGCQQFPTRFESVAVERTSKLRSPTYSQFLLEAESKATPEGRRVLEAGREMALMNRELVRGSCWDYANAIFERAGFPYQTSREVVMQHDIDFRYIQPGDFLSYVNHSYNDIKHTAIFVDWIDFDRKVALMLSYAGQKRKEPARYKPYDLSDVYYVARARN